MALSNSIDFAVTRDDIITEALQLLGVLGEGQTADQLSIDSLARTLNMMLKHWQAEGANLFAIQQQYIFLNGSEKYLLGDPYVTSYTDYRSTKAEGTFLAGETTIVVEDASGLSVGDPLLFFTVEGASFEEGSAGSTQISNISGNTLTVDPLNVALLDGTTIYSVNTNEVGQRPMKILEAYTRQGSSGIDTPLSQLSRKEYFELNSKGSEGRSNSFYYDPQIGVGELYVWPTGLTGEILVMNVQRTLDDLDASTDNVAYPQEWYSTIAYGLAMYAAPKYGIPQQDFNRIASIAQDLYRRSLWFDEETYTSVYFEKDSRN